MLLAIDAASAKVRELHWLDSANLHATAERLRAAVQSWSEAWGLGGVQAHCEAAASGQAPAPLEWQALAGTSSGRTLAWLAKPQGDEASHMATVLFDAAPPTTARTESASSAGLSKQVGADAWTALRTALARGLGCAEALAPSLPVDGPSPSDSGPWSGGVRAAVKLADGRAQWTLHIRWPLSADRIDERPVAGAERDRAPLQPLLPALARHGVRLSARLSDVPVSLGDLLGLQAGDVLLTPHRLAQPALVCLHQLPAPALWAGRLVQRDGQVALALVDAPVNAPVGAPVSARPSAPVSASAGSPLAARPTEESLLMSTSQPPRSSPSAQWLALPEATDPAADAGVIGTGTNPLLGIKATLQVCVGEAVLTVGELTQARAGQVIKLDRQVDGLADLMLDGKVVGRGQLVAVDDCFGVRLVELPQPLNGTGQ